MAIKKLTTLHWTIWSVAQFRSELHLYQLDSLPETISHSPLYIPGLIHPILRRDLYDARFQLTQKDTTDIVGDEEYVDSTTDLVPGLYEGGLKTWEGGIDLIQVLSLTNETKDWVSGSKVIEVGSLDS